MGPQEVVVVGVVLGFLVLPMIAVTDLLRQPAGAWRRVPHSRVVWLAVIVLVPVLGAALYLRRVRPALRGAALAV